MVREEEMGVSMRWMSASIILLNDVGSIKLISDAFKGKQADIVSDRSVFGV